MTDQRKAMLYGLAAVLLWSTVATAFKKSLEYIDPFQLLLFSVLASIATLAIVLALRGKLALLFKCSRREYGRSLLLGLLNPFLYYLVLFRAYDLLPAQEAQPLNYTWAITLTLLSVPLLKQRITIADLVATGVSYSGVLVIATRGDLSELRLSSPLGVGLALGSTVIWALYWIFSTRDGRDPVVGLLLNFVAGLPFVLGACLIFSTPFVSSREGLLGATYVGVFEMGVTFALWLTALRLTDSAARVSTLIFLSPFLSLLFIHLLLGEEILTSTFLGLALIVTGLLIQNLARHRRDAKRSAPARRDQAGQGLGGQEDLNLK